jgi:phosphinothricin acetyltransferase
MIRKAVPEDADGICKIYNHYVINTAVTFETEPVSVGEMTDRLRKITEVYPWLVYEEEGKITGYAYATRWKDRKAYDHSAECAVYVDKDELGRGIGKMLYTNLVEECRASGLHLLIGGITLPNEASIALHEKAGFTYIGKFTEAGFKFGKWVDVGYWTLIL